MVRHDYPTELAHDILSNNVGIRKDSNQVIGGRYTQWAQQYLRQYDVQVRRALLLDECLEGSAVVKLPVKVPSHLPNFGTQLICWISSGGKRGSTKKRKPGRLSRQPVEVKYGVKVPRNVKQALEFDREDGTTTSADAIKKEVDSLLTLQCFEIHPPGYKPSSEYQMTKLTMIFGVKQDGRRKA